MSAVGLVLLIVGAARAWADPGTGGSADAGNVLISWMGIKDSDGVPVAKYTLTLNEGGWDDPASTMFAKVASIAYEIYLCITATALWLIKFVLSFEWMSLFAVPFQTIGRGVDDAMDRFGLAATALAVLAIVVVCTVLAGRTAKAFSNIAMGMLMIGVAATIFANPLGELVGPDGLLAKGRDTGLEIATSVSDGAMSKQGDGANVDQMVSRLADRFLRSPTQMINFGAVADSISRKCREAWSKGTNNERGDKLKDDIKGCDSEKGEAMHQKSMGNPAAILVPLNICGFLALFLVAFACYFVWHVVKAAVQAMLLRRAGPTGVRDRRDPRRPADLRLEDRPGLCDGLRRDGHLHRRVRRLQRDPRSGLQGVHQRHPVDLHDRAGPGVRVRGVRAVAAHVRPAARHDGRQNRRRRHGWPRRSRPVAQDRRPGPHPPGDRRPIRLGPWPWRLAPRPGPHRNRNRLVEQLAATVAAATVVVAATVARPIRCRSATQPPAHPARPGTGRPARAPPTPRPHPTPAAAEPRNQNRLARRPTAAAPATPSTPRSGSTAPAAATSAAPRPVAPAAVGTPCPRPPNRRAGGLEPMEWVAIARTLWAHRRKVYAAAAMLAPFALTMLLVVFVLFAGGGSPATNAAALTTPQCARQMESQGVNAAKGVQFGPGPVNNGKAVIAAGLQMRIPEKGIIIALATAMQESGLRNLANPNVPESLRIPNEGRGRNHQSVGIFQQQPWWGTIRDLMTPRISALKFYAGLLKVGGWQQMAPTVAAQSVQQSAFPDAYADDVAAATLFYRQHLREVLTAAGPGASTPDSMDSDETENLCAASRPRASRSVYNLSKLPPGKAPEDRLQRYTILTNRAVSAAFPQIKTIGGYRPDSMKWHPQGLALDIMVSSAYPPLSPQGIALGNGIRDFLLKNAKTLGIDHVIWRQHIYYPSGTSEPMDDAGGLTANHFDHVHVATIGGGYPTPAPHPRRRRTHGVLRTPADPRTRRRRDRHPVGPGRATSRYADRLRRRAGDPRPPRCASH